MWNSFVRESNTWLGGKATPGSSPRTWEWEDSSAWSYTNWVDSADILTGNDCLHMQSSTEQWKDVKCSGKRPYVCKK